MKRTSVQCGKAFASHKPGKGRVSDVSQVEGNWSAPGPSRLFQNHITMKTNSYVANLHPPKNAPLNLGAELNLRGYTAGIGPDIMGNANTKPYREGTIRTALPGDEDTVRRMEQIKEYAPAARTVVYEETIGEEVKVTVVCDDVRTSAAGVVCFASDADLAPMETAGLHLYGHIDSLCQASGQHQTLVESVEEHYRKFGTIPMGCVGSLKQIEGKNALVFAHTPEYVDGFYDEERWLTVTYNAILDECRLLSAPSVAIVAPSGTFPLNRSAPLLAQCVKDWAELDCMHHPYTKSIEIFTETPEEAALVAACFKAL